MSASQSKMVLILAGKYVEAKDYAHANRLSPDRWRYADSPGSLRGIRPEDYDCIVIGTAIYHRDYSAMIELLREARIDPQWS